MSENKNGIQVINGISTAESIRQESSNKRSYHKKLIKNFEDAINVLVDPEIIKYRICTKMNAYLSCTENKVTGGGFPHFFRNKFPDGVIKSNEYLEKKVDIAKSILDGLNEAETKKEIVSLLEGALRDNAQLCAGEFFVGNLENYFNNSAASDRDYFLYTFRWRANKVCAGDQGEHCIPPFWKPHRADSPASGGDFLI